MRWSGLIKDDSAFLRHILDEINFLEESSSGIEFPDLMKNREIVWDAVKNEIPSIKLQVEAMLNEFELPE